MGSPYVLYGHSRRKGFLEPGKHISTSMTSTLDHCPFDPKFDREHLPKGSPYSICDMVNLSGKGNVLEPGNHISTSMTIELDLLTPNSIGNIFSPWVVHMCDMGTLGEKGF
jgi:hypothetical protein